MDQDRRALLNVGAAIGVGIGAAALLADVAQAATIADRPPPQGRPGEFDFLSGNWRIAHRQLPPGASEWINFEGEATCWSILNGVGSVEELRIPARNFSGMGLRLLDVTNRVWSDFWVNAKSGVLTTPGTTGGFVNGVGTFLANDVDGDQPIIARGMWDRITPTSCRWSQATSRDGGATWADNWVMDWRRA